MKALGPYRHLIRLIGVVLIFSAPTACRERAPASAALAAEDSSSAVVDSPELDARYGKPFPPAYSKTWETTVDGSTILNPELQHCLPDAGLTADPGTLQIWAILSDGSLV